MRGTSGKAAGSHRTGLSTSQSSRAGWPHRRTATPPRRSCSSSWTGDGHLLLGDEELPVRAGSVVARPAGTGVAHAFRAGEEGMRLLAYGTRDPNDICYYPRSNKIAWRGVGVIGRIEQLGYWDGETL